MSKAKFLAIGMPVLPGVLLAVSFPRWGAFPVAWVALVPLFWAVREATPRRASGQFLLAGWVFHTLVLQWLTANIFWAGGWATLGSQLLCIGLSLFWAILGAVYAWTRRALPQVSCAALVALLWVGMEWCQANLFTGFGWCALGYAQGPDLALAQLAALGGVNLISFALVWVNALLALAIVERRWRVPRIVAACVVVGLGHFVGYCLIGLPEYAERPFRAGIVQTNFPQEMKFDYEMPEFMVQHAIKWSRVLAENEQVDCFFWPEATVMRPFEDKPCREYLTSLVKDTGAWFFSGVVRDDRGAGTSYNSSALIAPDGTTAGYYDKVHLAPFGEYMPFAKFLPFLRQIVPSDVDAGHEQKVFKTDKRTLGPLICFEVLFGPMAQRLRRMGADCLVVVTNLSWFGASNAIPQEFELARMRAIETRLPLVQAANTGVSGVFDPWGRFAPVYAGLRTNGDFVRIKSEYIAPSNLLMCRRMGALEVAAPGGVSIPWGPETFPMAAGLGGVLWVIGIAFLVRRASRGETVKNKV